jgi:ubiquinone/menaquinone biosynthesis C-methylase UbiE
MAPTSNSVHRGWLTRVVSTNSFDERAATWDDDPAKVERADAVARAIRGAIPLDRSMRMLEYGAGTGLVTQALQGSVGPVTLADTSKGMREVIQDKIDAGAITNARVWELDLATQPAPDERFDLVVTVMTLHHVTNVHSVLSGFADLLDEGGHLCVVDLDEEDGSFHGADFEGHHGFERSRLSSHLTGAGFTEIAFRDCHDVVRGGVRYPLFLATCVRGGSARGP